MKKFRKFVVSAIIIGMMCGLSACGGDDASGTKDEISGGDTLSQDDSDDSSTSGNVDADWKSLDFTLNGTSYSFPLTWSDVENMGYTLEEEYANETLEPNYYTYSVIAENEEGETFYIQLKNFTDEDKLMKDCDVYSFKFENQEYRDVNPDASLCNGVTFGMTYEEVKELMGEPDYYYESEPGSENVYQYADYYVDGTSYGSQVSFSFLDGPLYSIEIINAE